MPDILVYEKKLRRDGSLTCFDMKFLPLINRGDLLL